MTQMENSLNFKVNECTKLSEKVNELQTIINNFEKNKLSLEKQVLI